MPRQGRGRSSTASLGCGKGAGRVRPDPPNSTGMRCDSLAAKAANMAFSFDEKGNAQPWRGLGSPFGCASRMRSGLVPALGLAWDVKARCLAARTFARWPATQGPSTMCMRQPEGRPELMAAKAATPDEAGELEGRYRLRRQRSWTSGQPQPPMKALWTRCPWEAIEVWRAVRALRGERGRTRGNRRQTQPVAGGKCCSARQTRSVRLR